MSSTGSTGGGIVAVAVAVAVTAAIAGVAAVTVAVTLLLCLTSLKMDFTEEKPTEEGEEGETKKKQVVDFYDKLFQAIPEENDDVIDRFVQVRSDSDIRNILYISIY